MSEEDKIKYKELCTKRIGDMEKDETIIFVSGLLDEIWDLENKIDKAIELIDTEVDELETDSSYLKYQIQKIKRILGDKENE